MKRWLVALSGAIALCLLLTGVVVMLYSTKPTTLVGLDTPIKQDDFTFTVTSARRTTAPHGAAYVVDIRVENHAKRVQFNWDPAMAHVVDANGVEYPPAGAGRSVDIPAGESATFAVSFELPSDVKSPVVRFDDGIMMGDVFDAIAYRRIGVKLPD